LEAKCAFCQAEKAVQERIDRATAGLRHQLAEVTADRDRLAELIMRNSHP
jgi:hypothetical protein